MQQFGQGMQMAPIPGATSARATGPSRNLSDVDLSSHLPIQSRGAGGLNIQFFYLQVRVGGNNRVNRLETRLCVAKQPKGDKYSISTRYITEEQAMREFPQEFSAFKRYQEVPSNGTPLSELPGISQSQIAMLTINGLRSIEDLAEISGDVMSGVGMDAVYAQKLAVQWVERKKANAEAMSIAETEAKYEADKRASDERFKAMEERNKQLQDQLSSLLAKLANGGAAIPEAIQSAATGAALAVEASPNVPDFSEDDGMMDTGGGMVSGLDDLLNDGPME